MSYLSEDFVLFRPNNDTVTGIFIPSRIKCRCTSSQISFLLELIQKENFISIFHSRGCNNGGDFVLYYGIPVRSF